MSPEIPADDVPSHTHEDAHFVLVLDGLYLSSARGASGILRPATLIYNPPGITHRDRFQTSTGRFFTIGVSSPSLRLMRDHGNTPDFAFALSRATLANQIVRECRIWNVGASLVVEGLCFELLASLETVPDYSRPPRWLLAARDLLHDRCAASLTIPEIARSLGVHPVHLARCFRRFFASSPGEYLRRCRLEKAASLLNDTRLPVIAIALETGFADQSHFTKAFRAYFGATPLEYRNGRNVSF